MLYYRNVNHYFHPWLACEINQVLLVYLLNFPFLRNLTWINFFFLRQSAKSPYSKVMNVPKYLFHFELSFLSGLENFRKCYSEYCSCYLPSPCSFPVHLRAFSTQKT